MRFFVFWWTLGVGVRIWKERSRWWLVLGLVTKRELEGCLCMVFFFFFWVSCVYIETWLIMFRRLLLYRLFVLKLLIICVDVNNENFIPCFCCWHCANENPQVKNSSEGTSRMICIGYAGYAAESCVSEICSLYPGKLGNWLYLNHILRFNHRLTPDPDSTIVSAGKTDNDMILKGM